MKNCFSNCFPFFHIFISRGAEGPGREILHLNFVFIEKQFFLISHFMLFSTLKKIETPRLSVRPSITFCLLVKWEGFLQIPVVDRDSWNLYPLYPLFPCSDFVSQMWGWFGGGGGGVMFSDILCYFQHF